MTLTKQIRIYNEGLNNTAPKLFDEVSGILYWDEINNQVYYELYKEMRNNFWVPDEISMAQDILQWNNGTMTEENKELYKDGIGILASLDSIATYFDKIASDYIRDSAVKANMAFIASMETIHNESYTYTLGSLVTKDVASEVFTRPKKNPFMVRRNRIMMDIFDDFLEKRTINTFVRALITMAGLEGLCFVNGFTPFYHLNRNKKMFGTGTIIQYIQRDEVKHSYFQSVLVRDILTQYPEYNTEEVAEFAYNFFTELVELEKEFCEDLYKNTSDIDLYEVKQYVEFRANLILDNLGLDKIFETKKNPMPWINAYDPDNLNSVKRDFFEDKEINYSLTNEETSDWDDL